MDAGSCKKGWNHEQVRKAKSTGAPADDNIKECSEDERQAHIRSIYNQNQQKAYGFNNDDAINNHNSCRFMDI